MVTILAIEFWPTCHLGAIAATFDRCGARTVYVRPEEGEALPREPDGWDGLVMLGGPQHAEDDAGYPYLGDAARLAAAFHEASRPVLGVCLGSQILARGLGARVRRQGWTEIGFNELEPTEAAGSDPLLKGIGPVRILEYHEDTFDIPSEATLLMTGGQCRNQVFRLGASYGFQCHFECSRELWEEWWPQMNDSLLETDPDFHARWPEHFASHEASAQTFCDAVSGRWLDLVETNRRLAA